MEVFESPVPVEWQNQRVLLTVQLAEKYGCSTKQLQQNFNKNKDRFVRGKHYFKLEGEVLKQFKADYFDGETDYFDKVELVNPRAPHLYLWTERGCARHAKMLSTDKAWEVFEALEDNYFNQGVKAAPVIETPVEKIRRPLSPTACVYALLMSNDNVKIGHSGNLKKRVPCIESDHKLVAEKIYHTPFISREIARLIEKACHDIFSPSKVDGEFFSIKFESACAVIDTFVKFVEALPLVPTFERGKILAELATSLKDSQTKEYVAISATNLIAGQCSA